MKTKYQLVYGFTLFRKGKDLNTVLISENETSGVSHRLQMSRDRLGVVEVTLIVRGNSEFNADVVRSSGVLKHVRSHCELLARQTLTDGQDTVDFHGDSLMLSNLVSYANNGQNWKALLPKAIELARLTSFE